MGPSAPGHLVQVRRAWGRASIKSGASSRNTRRGVRPEYTLWFWPFGHKSETNRKCSVKQPLRNSNWWRTDGWMDDWTDWRVDDGKFGRFLYLQGLPPGGHKLGGNLSMWAKFVNISTLSRNVDKFSYNIVWTSKTTWAKFIQMSKTIKYFDSDLSPASRAPH